MSQPEQHEIEAVMEGILSQVSVPTTIDVSDNNAVESMQGVAALPTSSHSEPSSSPQCSSTTMLERRSEFATDLEAEIEASKVHWTELQPASDAEDMSEANIPMFQSILKQWPNTVFLEDSLVGTWTVGKKIAEGAQAEIFKIKWAPKPPFLNHPIYSMWSAFTENESGSRFVGLKGFVIKIFKEGNSLQNLWTPLAMLQNGGGHSACASTRVNSLYGGILLKNGRCMENIAEGMKALHQDNITHRDLKASNVLILKHNLPKNSNDGLLDESFSCVVADFETSVGVLGTRFWRAPEVLLCVKNKEHVKPDLHTRASDVYSYAMTSYEILTGRIPFGDIDESDYDHVVLQCKRPELPRHIAPWIRKLLQSCWHQDPSKRPTFEEILEVLSSSKSKVPSSSFSCLALGGRSSLDL
ncbi:hypothetical protein KC19_4G243400 [Ceratodon purpureus]|uniref:Protein kinase domain-containing protein n=1 Tax=Ceratodon purpureus TaxID=3225 RepID=A0A8T0IC60_CERPU|nr:hypothetical protein KC19_4G243400 [Ceratodon purpureus]